MVALGRSRRSFIFVFLVLSTLIMIWAERRVVARMQQRIGPNRVGPFGLLQGLADGIKLALKEDIIPTAADKAVFILAPDHLRDHVFPGVRRDPVRSGRSASSATETPLQLTDFSVSVLYVLAIASIGVYGLVLAGWSSGSTYPLLGGLRSSAQVISYEIAMGLSFVAVFLYSGSMSTSDIVAAQDRFWFAIILLPSFLIYLVSMVGETNRAPFDLPEAEGELVGGFHTEYSSLKFALFFLAEYINMFTVAALRPRPCSSVAGRRPWPLGGPIWDGANDGWWPVLWFVGQALGLHVRLHLAARNPPEAALRPVHEAGLEGADPDLAGVDRWSSRRCGRWPTRSTSTAQQHPALGRWRRGRAARAQHRSGTLRRRPRCRAAVESADEPGEFDAFAGGSPCPAAPGTGAAPVAATAVTAGPEDAGDDEEETLDA